ncbi:hypothetical protein NDU88_005461 [Pleurodeles waltl]|uniref:Uncharacterized protein n=1 Tax=Pleurodeles waltl TaxID=8319 RepID=A0AAV7VM42_PLEWA|nr:hypothetical protein NDU88_005461 [Pleurodeles waltl]
MPPVKDKTDRKTGERVVLAPDVVFQNKVRPKKEPEEETRKPEKPRRDKKEREDKRRLKGEEREGAEDPKGKEERE